MQVEINNQDSILLPLLGHVIFGTDEACDVIFENITGSPKKICSVIRDKASCILEVFNHEQVVVNDHIIKELAILHPGDIIQIENQQLKIIDENTLPKNCSTPFKLIEQDINNKLITSVSGLRSFNRNNNGELAIVGSQNSFTHKPVNDKDIPFSVSYIDDNLTLLCKKDKHIFINGNKASYTILKNGDYISTGFAKYCVESPGTSSFSKYSPSHPRNIQLSEEYLVTNKDEHKESNGLQTNNKLWWIILASILTVITTFLIILKTL
ncbi:MAG: hypothetical protein JKY19_10465 [Alcanivoracaceae bacterium]|nr:hypothetical protein [Alcanivoracaceae bacterium]